MVDSHYQWVCGKCGSGSQYRDDDCIACPKCGNRYYGLVFGKVKGMAPKKQNKPIPGERILVEPHFAAERTANILTGPELFRFRKGVEDMGKRAPCRNCDRELTIVADGCCFLCYRAGKGLDGEEKEAALAAEAARIKGGKIKKAWNRGPEKIAPAFSLDPLPPVKARHDGPNEIPLTIRLTIEVNVRVNAAVMV